MVSMRRRSTLSVMIPVMTACVRLTNKGPFHTASRPSIMCALRDHSHLQRAGHHRPVRNVLTREGRGKQHQANHRVEHAHSTTHASPRAIYDYKRDTNPKPKVLSIIARKPQKRCLQRRMSCPEDQLVRGICQGAGHADSVRCIRRQASASEKCKSRCSLPHLSQALLCTSMSLRLSPISRSGATFCGSGRRSCSCRENRCCRYALSPAYVEHL